MRRRLRNTEGYGSESKGRAGRRLASIKLEPCCTLTQPCVQVTSWLTTMPLSMEGNIRPGCVFCTLTMMVDWATYAAAEASGLPSLVQHLLVTSPFWSTGSYMIQVGVVGRGGRLMLQPVERYSLWLHVAVQPSLFAGHD